MNIYHIKYKNDPIKIVILMLLALNLTSCKNDSSGGGFSFFSNEVENLGTPEAIDEKISSIENLGLKQQDSVLAFYKQRQNQPVWNSDKLRTSLVKTLKGAEEEGLFFQDYHGPQIEKDLQNLKNLSDSEMSKLDLLLTDAFLTYGRHLSTGKTDPKKIHEIWDVQQNKYNLTSMLEAAVKNNDIDPAIEELRPKNQIYRNLLSSLKKYKELKKDFQGFEKIPEGEVIKTGDKDPRISQIQKRLNFFGYLPIVDSTNIENSGKVSDAIKKFQEDEGIEADGIVGNNTIAQLNKGYDERYDQILVNLERWRWYPKDLGDHYILVNIANYELDVVKNGDTVSTHKTMVGREGRRTPVFTDTIDHIVFNPTWTIPPTIKEEDLIPGMRRNRNYLSSKNIGMYDNNGERVNPSRVNWSGDEAKSYVFRQNPGPTNPLGQVKIMYPNQYLIYLHDTPSQGLFNRNSRAESSGCVRVEDAVGLAKYLLRDQKDLTNEKIDSILKGGETTQIEMDQQVIVHHFYWTAWEENGKTRFTEDVYNYDKKILEALKPS